MPGGQDEAIRTASDPNDPGCLADHVRLMNESIDASRLLKKKPSAKGTGHGTGTMMPAPLGQRLQRRKAMKNLKRFFRQQRINKLSTAEQEAAAVAELRARLGSR
jgi:hypothetical protein